MEERDETENRLRRSRKTSICTHGYASDSYIADASSRLDAFAGDIKEMDEISRRKGQCVCIDLDEVSIFQTIVAKRSPSRREKQEKSQCS